MKRSRRDALKVPKPYVKWHNMLANVEQQQTCLSSGPWIVNVRHEGVTAMIACTESFQSRWGAVRCGPGARRLIRLV